MGMKLVCGKTHPLQFPLRGGGQIAWDANFCHPECNEGSFSDNDKILRFAQNDKKQAVEIRSAKRNKR